MHLLTISGFLGSGKTTLLIKLAEATTRGGLRVAVLVNEIGEMGIDDQMMRRLDLNVYELLNGCICCTLAADLAITLQNLETDYSPDLVLLEPSGVADPRNVLGALKHYRGRPLESFRCAVLLDPLRLPMLMEILTPLMTSLIQQAHLVIINKSDVASKKELADAKRIAGEIHPEVKTLCISATNNPDPALLSELLPWRN
jgi:G3E family GTPase